MCIRTGFRCTKGSINYLVRTRYLVLCLALKKMLRQSYPVRRISYCGGPSYRTYGTHKTYTRYIYSYFYYQYLVLCTLVRSNTAPPTWKAAPTSGVDINRRHTNKSCTFVKRRARFFADLCSSVSNKKRIRNSIKGSSKGTTNTREKLDELDKKKARISRMSEPFGLNLISRSFALQQSIRLVYMPRAFSRSSQGATRITQEGYLEPVHTESTRAAMGIQQNSGRLQREAGRRRNRDAADTVAAVASLAVLVLLVLVLVSPCWCCCFCCLWIRMHRGAQPGTTSCLVFVCLDINWSE